jgi:hypothetical protein
MVKAFVVASFADRKDTTMEETVQDTKAIRLGYLFIVSVVLVMALVVPLAIHAIQLQARPAVLLHH